MFTRDLGLIAQRLDLLAQDGVRHRGEGRAGLVHCSVVPGAPAIVADDFAGLLVDAVGVSELFGKPGQIGDDGRSEEHTSELQSLMRLSYAVFCLKKKNTKTGNEAAKKAC